MPNPKLYLANDTSSYHGGSAAVVECIKASVSHMGWDCVSEKDERVIERDMIEDCDAVLVNGEGTLHHSKPRAIHLLRVLEFAQSLGKRTYLCNASWFDMCSDFDGVLRRLDQCCVREILSFRELESRHGVTPDLFLDISFWGKVDGNVSANPVRFLTTDLYSAEFDCFVQLKGGPIASLPFLDMRRVDWSNTVATIDMTKVLITGRFHGLMAACRSRTRFVAYPGNTPKVDGLLSWFGDAFALEKDPRALMARAKATHRHQSYYDDFFDWILERERWAFET